MDLSGNNLASHFVFRINYRITFNTILNGIEWVRLGQKSGEFEPSNLIYKKDVLYRLHTSLMDGTIPNLALSKLLYSESFTVEYPRSLPTCKSQ